MIQRFANLCENLAAHNDVGWWFFQDAEIMRQQITWFDGTAVPQSTHEAFRPRMGTIENPAWLPQPIILNGPVNFSVVCSNASANNHTVSARFMGYLWTPPHTSEQTESPLQVMV